MSRGAPHGSGHWIAQRVTAVALVPLGLWFIFSLSTRADLGRSAWLVFVADPWHAVLSVLLLLVLLFHSYLGVQVVIEDYVQERWRERTLQALSAMIHVSAAILGAIAVARIASGSVA